LIQWNDADLLSVGTNETNRAEVDLVVYAGFSFDADLPPCRDLDRTGISEREYRLGI